MSGITDLILKQLGNEGISQLSKQIGGNEAATNMAVQAAIPMLMSALAKNAASDKGAQELNGALERDHDGGILDNLGGFLNSGNTDLGGSILKHVLGGKQETINSGIGKMAGLDANSTGKIVSMLAPIVLGQLGKVKKEAGLNANDLSTMLSTEKEKVEQNNPNEMGMLGKLLDQDGDGSIIDDVAGMLGKLF